MIYVKMSRDDRKDLGTYISQVSQFNLQTGLCCLGLRSDCHSDDLGVHDCVVPETHGNARQLGNEPDFYHDPH